MATSPDGQEFEDYLCLDCELLELRGYEYEVVINGCGFHVDHKVVRRDDA